MVITATIRQLNKYNDISDINDYLSIVKLSKYKNINIEFGPIQKLFINKNWASEIIELKKHIDDKKFKVLSTHAPYITNFYFDKVSKSQYEENIDMIKKSIISTKMLGCDLMVIHIGTCALNGVFNERKSIRRNIQFIKKFYSLAKKFGVKIAIENNTNFDYGYFPKLEEIRKIIDYFKKDNLLQFCFDTGHYNLTGEPIDKIKTLKDKLRIVHLHDNNKIKDEHKDLNEGKFDFNLLAKILKEINYKGILMSEVRYPVDDLSTKGKELLDTTFEKIRKKF